MEADAAKSEPPPTANTAPTEATPSSGYPPGLLTAKPEAQQVNRPEASALVDTVLLVLIQK